MILYLSIACAPPYEARGTAELLPSPVEGGFSGTGPFTVPPEFAASNSGWCWTAVDGQAAAIGLTTGEQIGGPESGWYSADDAVRWGDEVYTKDRDDIGVAGFLDGTANVYETFVPGQGFNEPVGVAVWDGFLAVPGRRELRLYDSPGALAANDAIVMPWNLLAAVSRFAIEGDLGYGAWHAGHSIDVFDIPSGEFSHLIELESFDGWIHGIHVMNDRLYLLRTNFGPVEIYAFELDGTFLESWTLRGNGLGHGGLWCETQTDGDPT